MNFYRKSDIPDDLQQYFEPAEIGLEQTPDAYVAELVAVFREVRRVLRDDGTLWLNLGDSYASFRDGKATPDTSRGDCTGTLVPKGCAKNRSASTFAATPIKHKDLIGIPWRVAFALQTDGWYLRQDIIWHKPNPMPESVTDRCTKAHEYIFLLSKSERYYFDQAAIAEDCVKGAAGSEFHTGKTGEHQLGRASTKLRKGTTRDDGGRACNKAGQETRNKRSVWTVCTRPYKGAHFATFPPALIAPMILAGCPVGGTVLDPFGGSGTTGEVSESLGRNSILIELNPDYIELQKKRTAQMGLGL